MNTILQIPVDKNLRDKASKASEKMGFSSLQESIRVFLNQMATNEIKVTFEPKSTPLSPKNERRYLKMINDVKTGKVKTKSFDNVNDLMKYLNK